MKSTKPYPSMAQSWGIVLIVILCTILFTLITTVHLPIPEDMLFALIYVGSTVLSFWIIHSLRKKYNGLDRYSASPMDPIISLVLVVVTICITICLTDPITQSIPMNDDMRSWLLRIADLKGNWIIFMAVIAAPIMEELIFRGVMLDGLLRRYSPIKAILFSSFLFGLIHLNPWQFVGAFFLGCLIGWVYYRTNNLLYCIFIHFVNNAMAIFFSRVYDVEALIDHPVETVYGNLLNMIIAIGIGWALLIISVLHLHKTLPKSAE